MADFVHNIAKGSWAQWVNNVNDNSPANSVITIMALEGAAADATNKDFDTFAAILAGGNTEATAAAYARIELDDGDLAGTVVDDTNDWVYWDTADQTWPAVGPGNAFTDVVLGYDSDSTGGTDANIVPMGQWDFSVTPNGGDITAQVNASGWMRAA